jgi:hypothetical protein
MQKIGGTAKAWPSKATSKDGGDVSWWMAVVMVEVDGLG